jgi:glycosyltransferase involved in cell wall biosynthesis
MNAALVSVVMPAYNASRFIKESINSVISQTYENWELIVIDDGSLDSTGAIVKEWAARESRIKYHYQKNGRQASARNAGISYALGQLIAFLDSDDMWLPSKLSVMIGEFSDGKQDLLFSDSYINKQNIENLKIETLPKFGISAFSYCGRDGLSRFLERNWVPTLTVMAKTDVLKSHLFDPDVFLAEDYDLWLRILLSGHTIRSISSVLAIYRIHSGSTSAADRECIDAVLNIFKNLSNLTDDPSMKLLIQSKSDLWVKKKIKNMASFDEFNEFIKCENKNSKNLGLNIFLNYIARLLFRINNHLLASRYK